MKLFFKILLGACFSCIPYFTQAAWQAPAGNPYSGNNSFPFISSVGNDNVYIFDKPLGIDSNFIVDTDTLFINEEADRIGILTNNPQTTLDVWGVTRIGQRHQSTFPVCNSVLEGTMIYNLDQNRLNICVGDAWRRIGYDGDLDHWLDDVDCNDSDPLLNPGVPEICGDTIDENCDGSLTLGCSVCYRDADNDGYGNPSIFEYMNTCPGIGAYVANNTDCDDGQYWTNPGGLETCDVNDNNCRNGVDEGCDDDNDNYCDSGMKIFGGTPDICPLTVFTVDNMDGDDCNDANVNIKPGASEICDNTVDENCDGSLILGCSTCYRDADNDSYGNASVTRFYNTCPGPGLYVANNTDCNDANVNIKPGALETCDNTDNNCASGVDEGCDDDNDNYCDSTMKVYNVPVSTCSSTVVANGANGNDCNDTEMLFNPGVPEICGDTIDENCDGSLTLGCSVCYRDADNDGYGNPSIFEYMNTCPGIGAYVANNTDCDDGQYWTNPGGLETCDVNDNNCRNGVDEGCDDDNDNYCDSGMKIFGGTPDICPLTIFTVDNMDGDDCNDANVNIRPGASEICDNTVDENCDGSLILGCSTCYRDADNDSYGNASVTRFYNTCPGPGSYVANNTDCNDANVNIKPGALETCDNTDNNCASGVDEGCDDDNDNYCDSTMRVYNLPVSTCSSTVVANGANGDDCNDELASLNPGSEICGDTVTNDCDAFINEGCTCTESDWTAAPACPSSSTCTTNTTTYGTSFTSCAGINGRPSNACNCVCRVDHFYAPVPPVCPVCRASATTIYSTKLPGVTCVDSNSISDTFCSDNCSNYCNGTTCCDRSPYSTCVGVNLVHYNECGVMDSAVACSYKCESGACVPNPCSNLANVRTQSVCVATCDACWIGGGCQPLMISNCVACGCSLADGFCICRR